MSDTAQSNWHEDAFFGIHYDLHANAEDTSLGKELSVKHLIERWRDIKPDWVQCDCKGHPGYTSWPSNTGSTSPGVVNDSLALHREATRRLGIKLGMHYSGVYDRRAIELHPEWAAIDAEGKRSEISTCRLSGYTRELMIPQFMEIIQEYDVDGFWVDGDNWCATPCWCDACRAEFEKRTGVKNIPQNENDENWHEWLNFHRDLFTEYVTEYASAVFREKPDCLVCSNWMYSLRQPEPVKAPVDYLSGDYSPNWGSQRAALEGRFLDSRNKTWDLMVWGKTKNHIRKDTHYNMKSSEHLCQEVSEVVALGGALMIYVIPQRTGWLNGWEHEIVRKVADFARQRKELCFKSKSLSDAAIGHLSSHFYRHNMPLFNFGEAHQPIEGAMDALLENHLSTDVIPQDTLRKRLRDYKLFVLPEQTHLDDELVSILEEYAENGGTVLASGAHLSCEHPELFGCEPSGAAMKYPAALPVEDKAFCMCGEWMPVKTKPGTEPLVYALKSLDPEKDASRNVVATVRRVGKGSIAAIHGPIFKSYFLEHGLLVRKFIGGILKQLSISPLVKVDAPPYLEIINRKNHGKTIINLINRGATETFSETRFVSEEIEPIRNVSLSIALSEKPKSVTTVPDDEEFKCDYSNGKLEIKLSQVHIHTVIAIEPQHE